MATTSPHLLMTWLSPLCAENPGFQGNWVEALANGAVKSGR
jgi:hypothetical protein